ncbi:MAG: acetylornithine deacetylase, partial [Proteobacteria bacterium]|nr:acetylornithine deacetylase [Pseudomonadota bacterium]
VVDVLARLVAEPTVSNRPLTELAAYMATRAEDQGFRVERFESEPGKVNVVASAGPVGTDGLILSGHMDVVPVEGQPWTSDPFVLTERGDNLLGRGSSDMKAFLAATVEGLERVDVSKLSRELVLVWTHDEEIGCVGSRILVEQLAREGRPLPKQCWIGEPTSMQVLRMHPGHVAIRVVTTGMSAHSSKPDLGKSALKEMTRVLSILEGIEEEAKGRRRLEEYLDRPYVTMNAAEIHGGSAVNMVPDRVELTFGYRPLPGDDPMEVLDTVRERVSELDASVELIRATQAMYTEDGTPLQGLLCPHACTPKLGAASFATDGGNFEQLGISSLIFGPGSIDVAHAPDEYVPRASLVQAVDIVEQVVRSRCS